MSDSGAEAHTRGRICRQGTRPVSAVSAGRERVRMLILLASPAQPHRSFREDINLSRHRWTSAPCHLLCYSPLVVSSISPDTASCSLLCFALTVLLMLTNTFTLFSLKKDTTIQMLWRWMFCLEQGKCKGRSCSVPLRCGHMGSSISPFVQAQNSSLLSTFCLLRPYEFRTGTVPPGAAPAEIVTEQMIKCNSGVLCTSNRAVGASLLHPLSNGSIYSVLG